VVGALLGAALWLTGSTAAAQGVAADEPAALSAPGIAVDRLVAEALARHPRLAAAHLRTEAADANAEAQGDWPWPRLEVALTPMAEHNGRHPIFQRLSLMQTLPSLDALDARTHRAKADASRMRAQHKAVALELGRAVRRGAAEHLRLDAEIEVNTRLRALWARLVTTLQDQLSVGRARQSDVLLAQVEVARLQNDDYDLRQRRVVARALLNTLLRRAPDAPLPTIEPPSQMPPDAVDELLAWVQKHHPTLAGATAEIAARRAAVAEADTRDNLSVTVGIDLQLMAMGMSSVEISPSKPGVMFMAGTTLPLWTGAVDAEARAARAAVHAAEAAQDDQTRALAFDVIEQHVRVESALRRLAMFDDAVLPLARESVAVQERAYAGGDGGVLTLLDAWRTLERFEIERVRAEAELAGALADLRYAVGRPDRPARRPSPATRSPEVENER
jgi:outer membrane protein TolC